MKKKINKIIQYINKNKYKKIIYASFIVLVLILIILLISLFRKDNEKYIYEYYDKQNSNIIVSDIVQEKPGTFIRNLQSLKSEHCKNDICIKNVVIYYLKDEGRIDYEIVNKSKRKATGAFKLKFDNGNVTYVVYSKLKKGESRKGSVSFSKVDYSNVYEYSLKQVKKDELKKMLKEKK